MAPVEADAGVAVGDGYLLLLRAEQLLQVGERGGGDGRAEVPWLAAVVCAHLLHAAEQAADAAEHVVLLGEEGGHGAQGKGEEAGEELHLVDAGLREADLLRLFVDQELHR